MAVEVREYFIPDFSSWRDGRAFEAAFTKLLVYLNHIHGQDFTLHSGASHGDWRRLEGLVEDIFKHQGFRTRLAQKTLGDDAEVILLDKGGGVEAIVELRRTSQTVSVYLVRQLASAQVFHDAKKAVLITTSAFDERAKQESQRLALARSEDLVVELWDGLRLLNELGCYNAAILPISPLKPGVDLRAQLPPAYQAPLRRLGEINLPGEFQLTLKYIAEVRQRWH